MALAGGVGGKILRVQDAQRPCEMLLTQELEEPQHSGEIRNKGAGEKDAGR